MLWETCTRQQHVYCGTTTHTHTVGTHVHEDTVPLCEDLGDAIEDAKLRSVVDGVQYGTTTNDFLKGRLCSPTNVDGADLGRSYFQIGCIKGECQQCEGLDTLEQDFRINPRCPTVNEKIKHRCYQLGYIYNKHEREQRQAEGKTTSRVRMNTEISETPDLFLHRLFHTMKTYAMHKHLAIWQQKRAEHLRENLPKGSILSEWDFAENYSFWHEVEIQQEYWYICTRACTRACN